MEQTKEVDLEDRLVRVGLHPSFSGYKDEDALPTSSCSSHKRCYFLKECVCVYRGGKNLIRGVGWQARR